MIRGHPTLTDYLLMGVLIVGVAIVALLLLGPPVSSPGFPEPLLTCTEELSESHTYPDGTVVYAPPHAIPQEGQAYPCWSPPPYDPLNGSARIPVCDAWTQSLQGGGIIRAPAYEQSDHEQSDHEQFPPCWDLPGWISEDELGPPAPLPEPLPVAGGGQVGGGFVSIGAGPWEADPDICGEVGTLLDANENAWVEGRTALEFPIQPPSADATVRIATLSILHASGNGLDTIAVYGYPGDGAIDASDIEVIGISVIDTHPSAHATPVYEHEDVTALLTSEVVAAGWVGFSIRQEPLVLEEAGSGHEFACPDRTEYPIKFPILTIRWANADPDEDADGVPDANDACPGTVADEFSDLLERRYRYDGTLLLSDFSNYSPHSIAETAGCAAGQIIAARGLDDQVTNGLDKVTLDVWIAERRTP
jgi:hypothetical protein